MMMGALACLSLTGCRDQDFDWEAAKLVNPEYAYKVNFEKEFGEIDPNQSWDFTQSVTKTRGTTDANYNPSVSTDYYYVEETTREWLDRELPEKHDENWNKGEAFVCVVPQSGFKITPIYMGNYHWDCTLYMVIGSGTSAQTVKLMEKGQYLEVLKTKCSTCNGTGKTYATCSSCNNGSVNCEACNGTGISSEEVVGTVLETVTFKTSVKQDYIIYSTTKDYYLTYSNNSFDIDDSSNKAAQFAIVQRTGTSDYYLYCINAGKFVTITGNNNNKHLSNASTIDNALIFTYNNGSSMKLGNYYIEYNTNWGVSLSVSTTNHNIKWNSESISNAIGNEIKQQNLCPNCGGEGTVDCEDCHGSGHTEESVVCSSCNGTGGVWESVAGGTVKNPKTTQGALAIRANSLIFADGQLPVGATLSFYLEVNSVNSAQTGYASKGDRQWSTEKMRYLKTLPKPSNIDSKHEVMIIACEASTHDDYDTNDLVLLIEGGPFIPQTVDVKNSTIWKPNPTTKRYMVEDLGATDASDIDFNDVVIDLCKTVYTEYRTETTTQGSASSYTETPTGNTRSEYSAKILALGGTKDLSVYVGDINGEHSLVFKKSTVGEEAQAEGSKIEFHTTYGGATEANPFSNVEKTVMYNTHYSSKNGDGKYDTNDYLFEVDLGEDEECLWNPSSNNIYVVVEESSSGVQVVPNSSNQTIITFPANGTVPTMIAVPTNQAWNYERVSVFTHDREGSKLQLQNYVQQTPTTEGN